MAQPDLRAVILAGGSGSRLWPLSRLQSPKQFLKLVGSESLLEATVTRLNPLIDDSQVTIVTSEDARGLAKLQEALYIAMERNSVHVSDFFRLPNDNVVLIGRRIAI